MKRYIAVEDIKKPQAEEVTDVEICRRFAERLIKYAISIDDSRTMPEMDVVKIDDIEEELLEMEEEE